MSTSRFACVVAVLASIVSTNVLLAQDASAKLRFDVHDFGAKGDGKTLDTPAIDKAIAAASAAGGGTVYFGAGTYPVFSIHLKSNVTLYLDQGSRILAAGPTLAGLPWVGGRGGGGAARGRGGRGAATEPGADAGRGAPVSAPALTPAEITALRVAPPVSPEVLAMRPAFDAPEPNPAERSEFGANQDFGHSHWHNSLIWGEDLNNVSILGPGMIDGNGLAYNPPVTGVGIGNKGLALKNCRNVILRDFTFFRAGHFAILATAVDNFTIDAVKFDTIRDAIDVVSCKNVRISNCFVNSPIDDGICLKADYSLGAPRDCENITITNCMVSGFAVGTMLDGTFDRTRQPEVGWATGRIKFGTESNGGFKNITISNCVFDRSRGLALEAVDGGIIEDVTITNITMRDITNSPIFIRLGNRHRSPLGDKTPVSQIRRVNISNISASNVDSRYPVLISGIPGHPIEDLQISNVRIQYKGGGTAEQAALNPAENEGGYPEPSMFGVLSASGFFIRHVKNLEMHHIDVGFDRPDVRPVFWMNDVAGADFQHMKIQRFENVPMFRLNKVSDFATQYVRSIADTKSQSFEKEDVQK